MNIDVEADRAALKAVLVDGSVENELLVYEYPQQED
jgi:hypothetical protein